MIRVDNNNGKNLYFWTSKSRHRCNSISYHHGDFEQLTGNSEATPYRLGDINPETKFALDHFEVKAPELLSDNLDGQEVILVDHNEFQQSVKQFLTQRLNTLWIIIESLISKLLHRFGTAQNQLVVLLLFFTKCTKNVALKLNRISQV